MRRILPISFILVAALVVLSASFVPHRHHWDEAPCPADCRDGHGNCIAEARFTDPFERRDESCGCGLDGYGHKGHEGHNHLYAIAILEALAGVPENLAGPEDWDFGELAARRFPTFVRTACGLRAPPAFFC